MNDLACIIVGVPPPSSRLLRYHLCRLRRLCWRIGRKIKVTKVEEHDEKTKRVSQWNYEKGLKWSENCQEICLN